MAQENKKGTWYLVFETISCSNPQKSSSVKIALRATSEEEALKEAADIYRGYSRVSEEKDEQGSAHNTPTNPNLVYERRM